MGESEAVINQQNPEINLGEKLRVYWPNQLNSWIGRLFGGISLKKEVRQHGNAEWEFWSDRAGGWVFERPDQKTAQQIQKATGVTPSLILTGVSRQIQFGEEAFTTDRTIVVVPHSSQKHFVLQEVVNWSKGE